MYLSVTFQDLEMSVDLSPPQCLWDSISIFDGFHWFRHDAPLSHISLSSAFVFVSAFIICSSYYLQGQSKKLFLWYLCVHELCNFFYHWVQIFTKFGNFEAIASVSNLLKPAFMFQASTSTYTKPTLLIAQFIFSSIFFFSLILVSFNTYVFTFYNSVISSVWSALNLT